MVFPSRMRMQLQNPSAVGFWVLVVEQCAVPVAKHHTECHSVSVCLWSLSHFHQSFCCYKLYGFCSTLLQTPLLDFPVASHHYFTQLHLSLVRCSMWSIDTVSFMLLWVPFLLAFPDKLHCCLGLSAFGHKG